MRIVGLVGTIAGAGLCLVLWSMPLSAHHAFAAEFDINQPVSLRGTVTKVEWINPHAWLHIDVKAPDGTIERWEIELGAPNGLLRRGWRKDSVPVGTEVLVEGFRSRNPKMFRANGRQANLPDGRKMFLGAGDTGAPEFEK